MKNTGYVNASQLVILSKYHRVWRYLIKMQTRGNKTTRGANTEMDESVNHSEKKNTLCCKRN